MVAFGRMVRSGGILAGVTFSEGDAQALLAHACSVSRPMGSARGRAEP
jgi:hypothetical protein